MFAFRPIHKHDFPGRMFSDTAITQYTRIRYTVGCQTTVNKAYLHEFQHVTNTLPKQEAGELSPCGHRAKIIGAENTSAPARTRTTYGPIGSFVISSVCRRLLTSSVRTSTPSRL